MAARPNDCIHQFEIRLSRTLHYPFFVTETYFSTRGFDSPVFTIIVGPEKTRFNAHTAYLSQSPVLDRMCNGNFKESHDFHINLPFDDPPVIHAMLQYLYSGKFLDFGTVESGHGFSGAADQLADI